MKRLRPISPELQAAISANSVDPRMKRADGRFIFTPKKNRAAKRAEANAVRRELKYDAQMSSERRARAEKANQATLRAQRAAIATRKRLGAILEGVAGKNERKTELGLVLPSGREIGEILKSVSDKAS